MTMKPDDYEGLVEFRTQAMFAAAERNRPDRLGEPRKFEELPERIQHAYQDMARATILREIEIGIVPCPVEATETFGYTSPYTPPEADNETG